MFWAKTRPVPVETTDLGEMLALTITLRTWSVRSLEGGPVQAAAAWALVVGEGVGEADADEEEVGWEVGVAVDLPAVEAAADGVEPPRC
jgi:hypothetical protein